MRERGQEWVMTKAILYDSTQCVGCLQCQEACARQNGLPYDDAIAEEQKASDHKFTVVETSASGAYMRRMCMHCLDPACVSVCPVGALEKTKEGPVVYDEDKCMGCRYCMVACPFGVPKYEWGALLPRVKKCTMCVERQEDGLATACATACPTDATLFGEREELLEEARRRVRENPSDYVNHVFGEKEVGGTSVLLLSAVPFTDFGFKESYPKDRLPDATYRVLSKIPDITGLGFVLLGGIWWITARREAVAHAELEAKRAKDVVEGDETGGES